MGKGPVNVDRRSGDQLISAFSAALGPDAVQIITKPDGSRAMAISIGGAPRHQDGALRLASWASSGARPGRGSPEQRDARRESLFERLGNITPEVVMDLGREYFSVFPPHPGADDLSDAANSGVSILSNLENYIFDPDRMTEMCRALQDAVRKVGQETSGPINILEAGYGLGYVGMSALALNEELGDRVRVIGLEMNLATIHRASQILDYYGVQPGMVELVLMDARTIQGLPDDIHILVAEHFSNGVFCVEPLHDVHRNLIPQLKPPFYIIPEGLDIHGRVVSRDGYASADDVRDQITRKLIQTGNTGDRVLEPEYISKLLPGVNQEIIRASLLTRIRFEDILNSGWDGKLDLNLRGEAVKNGKGHIQLRGVQTFHTDKNGVQPALGPDRFYANGVGTGPYTGLHFGTSINQWGHVRERRRIEQYMRSPAGIMDSMTDPFGYNLRMLNGMEYSPVLKFEKGKEYDVSVRGRMNQFFADIAVEEVNTKGRKRK